MLHRLGELGLGGHEAQVMATTNVYAGSQREREGACVLDFWSIILTSVCRASRGCIKDHCSRNCLSIKVELQRPSGWGGKQDGRRRVLASRYQRVILTTPETLMNLAVGGGGLGSFETLLIVIKISEREHIYIGRGDIGARVAKRSRREKGGRGEEGAAPS